MSPSVSETFLRRPLPPPQTGMAGLLFGLPACGSHRRFVLDTPGAPPAVDEHDAGNSWPTDCRPTAQPGVAQLIPAPPRPPRPPNLSLSALRPPSSATTTTHRAAALAATLRAICSCVQPVPMSSTVFGPSRRVDHDSWLRCVASPGGPHCQLAAPIALC